MVPTSLELQPLPASARRLVAGKGGKKRKETEDV
eukprot:COSAG04_NODE_17168_length_477_cov_0.743386_2_plen_33_part_01